MGFMDKAKAAANDLASKADTKLASSGLGGPGSSGPSRDADRYLRDLGVLSYLETSGRPASPEDRDRVLSALREMDARGALGALTLQTAAPPPPGAAAPPPPGAPAAPGAPAPSAAAGAGPTVASDPTPPQPPTAPPPPPPSWAGKEE